MRVLLTGASGFLGSHIYEALRNSGFQVCAASRKRGFLEGFSFVQWRYLDVSKEESIWNFDFSGFDVVVHNAGITFSIDERRHFEVNHLGTRLLVKRLEEVGFSGIFVHISSLAVHGPGRAKEDDVKLSPITPYGISKYMGELEVRASSLKWVIIRPPVIFGERDKALVPLYRLFKRGFVLRWREKKRISVVYAGNVASFVVWILERGFQKRCFLIKDATLSWDELAEKVRGAFGIKRCMPVPLSNRLVDFTMPIAPFLRKVLKAPVDRYKLLEMKADEWVVDSDLFRKEGFVPPVCFDDALSRTLRWCSEEGLL